MKQIIDFVPRNVKIVRLHELERSPEVFIQVIMEIVRSIVDHPIVPLNSHTQLFLRYGIASYLTFNIFV